jgi:hypothetical protein
MQIEPDILELIEAYGNACYFDGVQNQTTGDTDKPRQDLIDRIAALPARPDDSADRLMNALKASMKPGGFVMGPADECAIDGVIDLRAAIAALGGGGGSQG